MMLIPGRQWEQRPPARGHSWGVNGMLFRHVLGSAGSIGIFYLLCFIRVSNSTICFRRLFCSGGSVCVCVCVCVGGSLCKASKVIVIVIIFIETISSFI